MLSTDENPWPTENTPPGSVSAYISSSFVIGLQSPLCLSGLQGTAINLFLCSFPVHLNPVLAPFPSGHMGLLAGGPVSPITPGTVVPSDLSVTRVPWSVMDSGVDGSPHAADPVVPLLSWGSQHSPLK